MFDHSNDTTDPQLLPREQIGEEGWQQVQARLPEGWQTQGDALGAWRRRRKLQQPADVLRGLLAYVLWGYSLRQLACWSVLRGIGNLSETAWRKRLQRAQAWLAWLLAQVVSAGTVAQPWIAAKGLGRIILVDGTHLRCRGRHGMVARVHTAFDLLAGRLAEVLVTDHFTGENWNRFTVQPGDLFISDQANKYQQRLVDLAQRQAFGLVRTSLAGLTLYEREGPRMDLMAWLKGRHAPAGRICSRDAWVHGTDCWVPVQVVALRLSQQQRERALQRKRKKARQDKSKVSDRAAYGAGWLIVVSTLPPAQWTAAQLLALYRARWHIELLFKRIKQLLEVHVLPCERWERARASVLASLLSWALQEQEASQIRLWLREQQHELQHAETAAACPEPEMEQDEVMSEWTLAALCLDQLRAQVRGVISVQRFRQCWPHLTRFLRERGHHRTHWYSRVVAWLTEAGEVQGDVCLPSCP